MQKINLEIREVAQRIRNLLKKILKSHWNQRQQGTRRLAAQQHQHGDRDGTITYITGL